MKKLSEENFVQALENSCAHYQQKAFLLAISGGVDSMVLLQLCIQLKIHIEVAHINYHLRAENSDADEALVTKICAQNHIPIHIYHTDFKQSKNKNIQTWAREIRYDFFHKIRKERKIDYIMTAHHLNDQLETFFIHLMRGTGIRGLCGIPNAENKIIRPLLNFSKKEIYDFALQNAIPFREDESNTKNIYQRNFLRNEIIPQLEKIQPMFLDNFRQTLGHLQATQKAMKTLIEEKRNTISQEKNEQISLDKDALQKMDALIQYEILKPFGMQNSTEIEKIFHAETGAIFMTQTHKILINRNEILIQKNTTPPHAERIFIPKNHTNAYEINLFHSTTEEKSTQQWHFDASQISFPLELRPRKEGDRFQPKGMKGTKLVSKYLKDEKINQFDKEKCRVLCDASGKILGVLPYRQDGDFSIKELENPHRMTIIF